MIDQETKTDDPTNTEPSEVGCPLPVFTEWMQEIINQPPWRARADREMDYRDGNQLDANTLAEQRLVGMPPAIEPLIGPTIDSILGMEAKTRTDWRVIPAGDKSGDEVAQAIGSKLNDAERHSKADDACSEAYSSQVTVGIGWVEVARESNPFRFPYRCSAVHRNEIWWDFLDRGVNPEMPNSRYLVRRQWKDRALVKLMFPDKADLIEQAGSGWGMMNLGAMSLDGGQSTDLAMSYEHERGWSVEEQEWRDAYNKRVCLFEVWYRVWTRALVMKLPDGRVIEVDQDNEKHLQLIAAGIKPKYAIVDKMRMAWYMGPHLLHDGPTPYRHNKFPYVPFWGKREDRTGVPYALARGMMFLQDEINARIAKMHWGLGAVRTTRTDGAVAGTDEKFRQEVARPDADIILDAAHMAKVGAMFKVERDFELNNQQYQRLVDAREGIKRVGGIYAQFEGQKGTATSGVQFSAQVEQSNQNLADINDNLKTSRALVGDLLVSMIVEDMIGEELEVEIDGHSVTEDKRIALNTPTLDDETGETYLTNDVERTLLKVVLNDVPSTPTYRTQQLAVMGEAFKSAPPEYQKIMMPYLFALMDVPNKNEMIEAIKGLGDAATPEQIQQQIEEAVEKALLKANIDLKMRELDIKERGANAQAVKVGVEAAYAAMQAGQVIATMPSVAPIADVVMQNAGYQTPNPGGVDPNFPQPAGVAVSPPVVNQNTSPALPPVPEMPGEGALNGIETQRTSDNLQGA